MEEQNETIKIERKGERKEKAKKEENEAVHHSVPTASAECALQRTTTWEGRLP